jgi:hypothetical protein
MRKSTKVLGAISIAGVLAAGGAAFTATGITTSSRAAASSQFIGGTVGQGVESGVNLANIAYATNGPGTVVTGIDLTFVGATADGKTPTLVLTAGAGGTAVCSAVVSSVSKCNSDGVVLTGNDLAMTALTNITVSLATTTTP